MKVNVNSEIGNLQGVIIHHPGSEIENMTPQNAERALYSDILNLSVATKEYCEFEGVLRKFTKVYEVKNLLKEALQSENIRRELAHKVCTNEKAMHIYNDLISLDVDDFTKAMIEGVEMKQDTLTNFLSQERYALRSLHNFFFMRDASISMFNEVLISRMANVVRAREAIIMETIFDHCSSVSAKTINPINFKDFDPDINIEGGDVIIASNDVILVGLGSRSNTKAVDFLINRFKENKTTMNIVVQELPPKPESFIHLDMVFTFLDIDKCMIYEPLIAKHNKHQTVHIRIENGKVDFIRFRNTLMEALKILKFDLKPLTCGTSDDLWVQQREQWHSGTNFFALGPGKVMGYGRNSYTMEEMSKNGFEVIKARDILKGKRDINEYHKFVVAIEGSELPRGGGGARCMTMPVAREKVEW
ncbi:MAG: arginine deiminase family protein [Bacteroidetes bacterium]|nr:arginine deiminase family protein [Bacteroidota bacterium]